MSLRSEPTSKSLEKKLLIMGFEIPDVLAIFLILSILNFSFGSTNYKFLLVWLPVILLALLLRLGKRGKPDNYLIHLVKYQVSTKYLSAFENAKILNLPPKLKRK